MADPDTELLEADPEPMMWLADAPDPEAFGKIRNIVKSAHKWGGDGAVPKFRKIKDVLMTRHPEVIAHAFGGNPNVAAAWIKDNWYSVHGRVAVGKHGSGPTYWRGKGRMGVSQWYESVPDEFVTADTVELFCAAASGDAVEQKDGLIWKVALRTGKWKRNPIPGAKGPLVVDKAFLDELKVNFDDQGWEHVTIPLSHVDRVDENTGYVRQLEVVADPKRKGQYLLKAGMEFTEPDIKGKVERKSIANVSVGVGFDVVRTEDGKKYGRLLKHIALTNMPWINGLTPFGEQLAASILTPVYEEEIADVDTDDLDLMIELARPAKPKFDENVTHDAIRNKIQHLISGYRLDADGDAVYDDMGNKSEDNDDGDEMVPDAINPDSQLYVTGVSDQSVLVSGSDYSASSHFTPVAVGWVFGYDVAEDGDVTIDPVDEWMPVQKTWIRLAQEFTLSVADAGINDFPASAGYDNPAGDQTGGETLLVGDETRRGGDKDMEDKTETTEKTEKVEETVTLSREDVDQIVNAKVAEQLNAAKDAAKAEALAEREALETELASNRRAVHEMKVEARVAELNASGYEPALVKKIEEFMLADERRSEVLNLSREEGEVKLSVTSVIDELLPLIEAKSLVKDQPKLHASKTAPAAGDSVEEGNKLYEELFGATV